MKYIEEIVVGGAVVLGVVGYVIGDENALLPFLTVLGYIFGRAQKINGALSEQLNKKK